MSLSAYHQSYSDLPDEEITNRAAAKEQELSLIFEQVNLETADDPTKIAVLGCGDKRFIPYHREIFATVLRRPVEIFTFDITIDHLLGEQNVICHDCTLAIPHGPFDITYAHVLLRFIDTDKQWDLIVSSYDALKKDGLAIHVMDEEDYRNELPERQFTVPWDRWKAKLDKGGIKYKEIPVPYGLAVVLIKE